MSSRRPSRSCLLTLAALLLCTTGGAWAASDLALNKSGPVAINAGERATYTVTVTNLGPDATSTVNIYDTFPANTTFVSFFNENGVNCTLNGTPPPNANCSLTAALAAGAAVSFNVVLDVSSAMLPGDVLTNSATVTSPDDAETGNNTGNFLSTVTAISNFGACPIQAYQTYLMNPPGEYRLISVNLTNGTQVDFGTDPNMGANVNGINAIGFNVADRFIYGWQRGPLAVMRIGSDASAEFIGPTPGTPITPSGWIAGQNSFAGDVRENRLYLLLTGLGLTNIIKVIDIPTNTVVDTITLDAPPGVADMAFHPTNGRLYGVQTNGQIQEIDLDAATVSPVGTPLPNSFSAFGAVYIDNGGTLYTSRNDGFIYAVADVGTAPGTPIQLTDDGPITGNNDGARCVNAPEPPLVQADKDLETESGSIDGLAEPGEQLTYTITLTNTGTGPTGASNEFFDILPANTTLVSVGPTGVTTDCNPGDAGARLCTITVAGAIPPGGSTSATLVVQVVDPIPPGTNWIYNIVTDTTDLTPPECPTSGASCTIPPTCDANSDPAHCVTLPTPPNLEITKSGPANATFGVAYDYTITVTNSGADATADATVTDSVPVGLTINSVLPGFCSFAGQLVTCTIPQADLESVDPAVVITINVTPTSVPFGDTVTNTASVGGGGDPGCTTGCTSPPVNTTVAGPNLTVVKSRTGDFSRGQIGAAYTIVVGNDGGGPTIGLVSVTDTPPPGLTPTSIGGPGWTCVLATLTCQRSDALLPGQSYPTITLIVDVASNAASPIINQVTATGGGDPSPVSDEDSQVVSGGGGEPNLTVVKSHTGNFSLGQIGAAYTMVVGNAGSGPTSGLVSVTDTPPPDLASTSIGGTGWTCVLATLTCQRSDALLPGQSYPPITLIVDVASNAASPIINRVTATGGGDPSPADDEDSQVVSGGALPVDTNPNWAIAMLLAMILLAAGRAMRKHGAR